MSQSSILQQIANKYMLLAQTDLATLAGDMTLALPSHEAPMPAIEAVEKVIFSAEPGFTPHISVHFTSTTGAKYCWDMTVRIVNKREFDSSMIKKTPYCYGALTLMKTPDEVSSLLFGPGSQATWGLQKQQ